MAVTTPAVRLDLRRPRHAASTSKDNAGPIPLGPATGRSKVAIAASENGLDADAGELEAATVIVARIPDQGRETAPLEDRAGIGELFARYAWALDTADFDAFVACFAPDGVLVQARVGAQRDFAGADRLRAFATELCRAEWFRGRQHHVSNVVFGNGRPGVGWELSSYVLVTQASDSAVTVEFTGSYYDRCVKHDSEWKFGLRRYRPWQDGAAAPIRSGRGVDARSRGPA